MRLNVRGVAGPFTKLTVFIAVTAVAITGLGLVITNSSGGDFTTYSARFHDVTGLVEGDELRISGVRVGQVTDMRRVDGLAEVDFEVEANRRLPSSATVAVRYRNLVGQRYLALGHGAAAPGETLAPGAVIPPERTTDPLNLTALLNGFRPLFQALSPDDVNKLAFEIIQVLQGEGGTMESLLRHVGSLTNTIADRDQVVGDLVDNFNVVLATVAQRDRELGQILTQLQQLVSGLAEDREPIGDAVAALGELGKATSGLLAEARPPLRKNIPALGELSRRLADEKDEIEPALRNLPIKANKMVLAGSAGGNFFQFFLCSVSVQVGWSAMGIEPVQLEEIYPKATLMAPQPRCRQ